MKSTMMTRLVLVLAISSLVFGSALAGDLEPPGPPAPTMVTLQEIYDLIQGQAGSVAAVAKTGQTGCWSSAGASIACAGTGQDGEYQYGAAVSKRFTDNGDGTVEDNLTGLIWLKNANCFGLRTWTNALADANTLFDGACGLTDSSVAGDWRLPNLRELHSLIDYQNFNLALPTGHPFSGMQSDYWYWSSTTAVSNQNSAAWTVNLYYGLVHTGGKTFPNFYVWPVRGGQ